MFNEKNRTIVASSNDGSIPIWTVEADEGKQPGILILPTIFGIDEGSKTLARDLASTGANVWIADQFWRKSPGPITPRDEGNFAKGISRAKELDMELAVVDAVDLIKSMKNNPNFNGKVLVLGLCFAGKFSLLLTSQGYADAGASFHGTGIANMLELVPHITVPLSLHFGDSDIATPVSDVSLIQEAFKGHDNVDVVLHEGDVKHGFGDPASKDLDPDVYKKLVKSIHELISDLQ